MRVFLVLLYLYASYVIAQPKNETFDFELYKNLGKMLIFTDISI